MAGEIKHVVVDVLTSPKVAPYFAVWGIVLTAIKDYLNPTLLILTPILSFVLILVLIKLHRTNSKKADIELEKLKLELDREKRLNNQESTKG